MTIETVFFDLGGVLIDFNHDQMCQNIARLCSLDDELVRFHLFEKGLGERYERGAIDSEALYRHFQDLSQKTFTFSDLMEAACAIFKKKDEMPPLLEALKHQGKGLFLLSNTCQVHIAYVTAHFPFLKLFDGMILSFEVGARKPEPAIFLAALNRAGKNPAETFFIDDVERHVEGAKKLGIGAHHFTGKEGLIQALSTRGIYV